MNPSQVVLKLVHDAVVGPDVRIDSFEQRLIIQKKLYLTQLTGLDLGYRFAWYLFGPYCRELTSDIFRLKEQIDDGERDYENRTLGAPAHKLIAKAKTIWDNKPGHIDENDWVELLASLHYLKHIAYFGKNAPREFDDVFDALIQTKPRFAGREEDARMAWSQLARVGLIAHKIMPAEN
jgi:hypothetical protein